MTRRTFLAASLIGGLMLAVGMRPRVMEPKEQQVGQWQALAAGTFYPPPAI